MTKIVVVHFKGSSETVKVTPEQADWLAKARNSGKGDNFVKLGAYQFPPSIISYMKEINGEEYDLTAYNGRTTKVALPEVNESRRELLEKEYTEVASKWSLNG